MAALLLMVSTMVPKSARHVPRMGRFIMYETVLVVTASCVAMVNLYVHLHGNTRTKAPPLWYDDLRFIVSFASLVC